METTYDLGVARQGDVATAMWFGDDVFFYVAEAAKHELLNARLPANRRELPHWVLPLLYDHSKGTMSRRDLANNVDGYLTTMQRQADKSLGIRLLRRVNWAALPLHWQPAVIRDVPMRVLSGESAAAQRRLVENVAVHLAAEAGEDPVDWLEAQREAVAFLGDISGVPPDERLTPCMD